MDALREIKAAIEHANEWEPMPPADYVFRSALSRGWTITVGYGGRCQGGTAIKNGVVIVLTQELALLARRKAEGSEDE